jgi:hypothetical protein
MSIAITGPARYIYQDKVILEQILRFWTKGISCVYEPKNGEDATICFNDAANTIQMEIQVKGAEAQKAALNLKQLAEYLAHFPEHSDKSSLIERLCADGQRRVLLVCAQRATDDCAPLIKLRQWQGEIHDKSAALTALANQLVDEFAKFKNGIATSGVDARRILAIRDFSTRVTPKSLRDALCRLLVLDQWDEEYVDNCIKRHLTEKHSIPGDAIEDVSNRLRNALRSFAGTGKDVIPLVTSILEEANSLSIRPLDYIPRAEEQDWRELLAKERVLLLSGPPRCGKSETACSIAADYESLGFSVVICYSVGDAERLVRDPGRANIVVVLDDPLGAGIDNTASAFGAYTSLSRLIGKIPMNRRLVVSQSQEPLLASAGAVSLAQVITASRRWHDLSAYPTDFLESVWAASASKHGVSKEISELVNSGLINEKLALDPGTLNHLAANANRLPVNSTLDDIHALAAQSAQDFAISLCATPVSKNIVRALAIGSSDRESLAKTELAFIIGSGGAPKIPAFPGMIYGFGSIKEEKPQLPSYDEEPSLSTKEVEEISNLQHHSIIVENRAIGFRFTHPYYRAAARAAVIRSTSVERDILLELVTRGLLSLSPSSSTAAARNLTWLYRELNLTIGLGEEIIKAAEKGLRWYFPEVRDLCYEFLIAVSEIEPTKYSQQVGRWIAVALSYGMEDIQWADNVPFIPEGMEQSWLSSREFDSPEIEDISVSLDALRNGGALPKGRQAVEILRYFRKNIKKFDKKDIDRLLNFSEGILRASAAAIWLSTDRDDDKELLDKIFQDSHPKVVADSIASILVAWPQFNITRKKLLVEMAEPWCQRPETAAAILKQLFSYFYKGDDWYDEEGAVPKKSWEIFAELFPRAIRRFPISFWLSDSKVYSVCQDALKVLSSEPACNVALAWASMIDRKIRERVLPSDFELGVVSSVLQSPAIGSATRRTILEFVMSIPSTGAVLVFVADSAEDWTELSQDERSLIIQRIASLSSDSVWVQASVLTRAVVPQELEKIILGPEISLSMPPSDLVERMNPSLLSACVKLYRGEPQPLWYLGKHHSRSTVWKGIIKYIVSLPSHDLFEDCVAELITMDDESLFEVIQTLDSDVREIVFNQVIESKVGVVGEWHQKVVDSLLNLAPDDGALERMQRKMTSRAIAVLESVSDIAAWTTHSGTRKSLLIEVEGDAVARKNVNIVWEMFSIDKARAKNAFAGILDVMNSKKPLLHETYSEVLALGRKVGASQDVIDKLERNRLVILHMHHDAKQLMKRTPSGIKLPNWVGPGQ